MLVCINVFFRFFFRKSPFNWWSSFESSNLHLTTIERLYCQNQLFPCISYGNSWFLQYILSVVVKWRLLFMKLGPSINPVENPIGKEIQPDLTYLLLFLFLIWSDFYIFYFRLAIFEFFIGNSIKGFVSFANQISGQKRSTPILNPIGAGRNRLNPDLNLIGNGRNQLGSDRLKPVGYSNWEFLTRSPVGFYLGIQKHRCLLFCPVRGCSHTTVLNNFSPLFDPLPSRIGPHVIFWRPLPLPWIRSILNPLLKS